MKNRKNVAFDSFPQQNFVGREVMVSFGYANSELIPGEVVRNDMGAPGVTIIKLNDGRFVLGTECFWDEVNQSYKNEHVAYHVRDVSLSEDMKHVIVGSLAARDHLDFTNYPAFIVRNGEMITDVMFYKMLNQGSETVTIRETLILEPQKIG